MWFVRSVWWWQRRATAQDCLRHPWLAEGGERSAVSAAGSSNSPIRGASGRGEEAEEGVQVARRESVEGVGQGGAADSQEMVDAEEVERRRRWEERKAMLMMPRGLAGGPVADGYTTD